MTDDVSIRPLDRAGDLGWVLTRHGELYADEYGWATEAVTARILADYAETARPGRDAAWVAELGGHRVGCVFLVGVDATTAKLRLLLVDPAARGHGIGRRLVDRCVEHARALGYRHLVLWTNEPLASARRIYLAVGFALTAEATHEEFGPTLRGQEYALDLTADPVGAAGLGAG